MATVRTVDVHSHCFPEAYLTLIEGAGAPFSAHVDRSNPKGPSIVIGATRTPVLDASYWDLDRRRKAIAQSPAAHPWEEHDVPALYPALYIVASDRPDVFGYLSRAFLGDDDVRIVVDRRAVERRCRQQSRVGDRRTGTDRRLTSIDRHQLSLLGWVLVAGTSSPPS